MTATKIGRTAGYVMSGLVIAFMVFDGGMKLVPFVPSRCSERSPDRPEAGRAYQADKGAGAIPNASVSPWPVKGAGVSAGTFRLGQAALATAFADGFADSMACM